MKLISWNVNGLRALERKGHFGFIRDNDADIICLQETKASPDQLSDELLYPDGFESHFASSTVRKGYSGVATYSRHEPEKTIFLGIKKYDEQGRVLVSLFEGLAVVNVYVPNGNSKTASLSLISMHLCLKLIGRLFKRLRFHVVSPPSPKKYFLRLLSTPIISCPFFPKYLTASLPINPLLPVTIIFIKRLQKTLKSSDFQTIAWPPIN